MVSSIRCTLPIRCFCGTSRLTVMYVRSWSILASDGRQLSNGVGIFLVRCKMSRTSEYYQKNFFLLSYHHHGTRTYASSQRAPSGAIFEPVLGHTLVTSF